MATMTFDRTPPVDLAVTGGRLVLPDGIIDGTITVRNGRISDILPADAVPAGTTTAATRTINVGGAYVLPGLIDSHVHFRTPGLVHKEDWAHGSHAAVAGGVTTVIDMPNTRPPLFDPAAAAAKADIINGSSLVDFRFHLGVDPDRPELITTATPRQAISAKVFMAGHHCAPNVVRTPAQLERIFRLAQGCGMRLVLHAEDQGIFELLDKWRNNPARYQDYEPARPRSGGIVAAAAIIRLVAEYGTSAHVLHVSSAEEADMYSAAVAAGLPITFEVTAHHLSFSDHDIARYGSRIRLSPAIRQPADRDRLWAAVFSGQVSTIGSDHAPHLLAEKCLPPADAPPGLPGVQEMAGAVFTGMRRRQPWVPIDDHLRSLARLCASAPADLFGLAGQKGRLAAGADADLMIFDPHHVWSFDAADIRAKCGWSAYSGWMFTGRTVMTLRCGEVVYDAATATFGAPTGRWLDVAPAQIGAAA